MEALIYQLYCLLHNLWKIILQKLYFSFPSNEPRYFTSMCFTSIGQLGQTKKGESKLNLRWRPTLKSIVSRHRGAMAVRWTLRKPTSNVKPDNSYMMLITGFRGWDQLAMTQFDIFGTHPQRGNSAGTKASCCWGFVKIINLYHPIIV